MFGSLSLNSFSLFHLIQSISLFSTKSKSLKCIISLVFGIVGEYFSQSWTHRIPTANYITVLLLSGSVLSLRSIEPIVSHVIGGWAFEHQPPANRCGCRAASWWDITRVRWVDAAWSVVHKAGIEAWCIEWKNEWK